MRQRLRPGTPAFVEMLEQRALLASATIGVYSKDIFGSLAGDIYRAPSSNAADRIHFDFERSGPDSNYDSIFSYTIDAAPYVAGSFSLETEDHTPVPFSGTYSNLNNLSDIYVVAAGSGPLPDVELTLTITEAEPSPGCGVQPVWTKMPAQAKITIHGQTVLSPSLPPTPQAGFQGRVGPPMGPQISYQTTPGLSALPSSGTAGGINGFNGAAWIDFSPFTSDGFAQRLGMTRGWTNVTYSGGASLGEDAPYGKGFVAASQPALRKTGNGGFMVINSVNDVQWFDPDGSGGFAAKFFGREKLAVDGSGYKLTDTLGNVTTFFGFGAGVPSLQQGKFSARTAASGRRVEAYYAAGTGRVETTTWSFGASLESYVYAYHGNGQVSSVTLKRGPSGSMAQVRKVAFAYYGTGQAGGGEGNLQYERVYDASDNLIGTTYFRYYTAGAPTGGYVDGLKLVVGPEAYARLAAAYPDPTVATDAQVRAYADRYFEYDNGSRRVTLTALGAAGASGPGQFTYSYGVSAGSPPATDYNAWKTKTVETLPDGNQNITYYNSAGELVLDAFYVLASPADPSLVGKIWATSYRYDGAGRLVQTAYPSALTLDTMAELVDAESNLDLVGYSSANGGSYEYIAAATGLIEIAEYAGTTTATASVAGDAAGYLRASLVKNGHGATPILVDQFKYYFRADAAGSATYPLATSTVYATTSGTGARTTSYSYTWQGSTAQPESIKVTLPAISAAQGGPGATADFETTFYDSYGRPTWSRDGDGFLHYTAYDEGTGAVVKDIIDVNTALTGNFANLPSGWATPAGGGLNLITTYQVDNRGRATRMVDPRGSITHWVYKDAQHEVRTYRGWDPVAGTATGPIEVTREDWALGYDESFTLGVAPAKVGSPGSYAPTGLEAFTAVLTLSRDILDENLRVVETDDYFKLDTLTYSASSKYLGSINVNYNATLFGFDVMGRPSRVVDATGTIDFTAYDGPGRVATQSVGTTDANRTVVLRHQYDGGLVGDGNLTATTAYPGGTGIADRVTAYAYDWRDRLVATKGGVQGASESTSADVQRQIIFLDLNNLGEVIAVAQYDGDNVALSAARPAESSRRSYATTAYDDQGRPYQQQVASINQATGAESAAGKLTTRTAYDRRGNPIAVHAPGGLATKTRHDGAGRAVVVAATDGSAGTTWAAAGTTAGDRVLAETRTAYDAAGNPIQVTTLEREHDAIGTGALDAVPAGDGLMGTYFGSNNLTGGWITRLDPTVNFDWNVGAPISGIGFDGFSVRWLGFVDAPASGLWTFYSTFDEGVRLWVDGQLLIDDWSAVGSRERSGRVQLQAGRLYAVRLEYLEVNNTASVKLEWAGPGTAKQVVPQARLHTAPTAGDGLSATYYDTDNFGGVAVSRVDPAVAFETAGGGGSPDPAIGADTFTARWTGTVDVPYSETWTFYSTFDDGVRLWVDGQLLIDDWASGASREKSGQIFLLAGRLYSIRMEYLEIGGGAAVKLEWSGPVTAKQLIPQARLHSANPTGDGLRATFFDNVNFAGTPVGTRVDPSVAFDWGNQTPDASFSLIDNYSVQWTGSIRVPTTGTWTFTANVDDGARLYIFDTGGNVELFSSMIAGAPRDVSGSAYLTAGRSYAIRLDYLELTGGARIQLDWAGPGVSREAIPPAWLSGDASHDVPAAARASYQAFYYDAADRPTAAVDVGTNGGFAYARPATPPARSDVALVTEYRYNAAGWVDQVTDPRGLLARTSYDALGRAVESVANATATPGPAGSTTNVTTRYTYDGIGQVREVIAVQPAGSKSQTTTYVYGVTTSAIPGIGSQSLLYSNRLLAAVVQPDKDTGDYPSPYVYITDLISYRYNALGEVVQRTNAGGTSHAYTYDVLGRQLTDAVLSTASFIDVAVRRMETAYDTAGRAYLFTSYNAPSGGSIVDQVRREFNGLGQIAAEYQSHSGAVVTAGGSASPRVAYAYTEMAGGQNNSRLASMTYPIGRVVRYDYKAGLDAAIGRVSAVVEDAPANPGGIGVALETYKYLGLGTVVERSQPTGGVKLSSIRQPGDPKAKADAGDRYTGLDRFGRAVDQNWVRTGLATAALPVGSSSARIQYRHDRNGNAVVRSDLVNLALSELYEYDGLDRLTSSRRGELTRSSSIGPFDTIASPGRQQGWTLDALGNWTSASTNGSAVTRDFNAANQVSGPSAPTYDDSGNTTAKDGRTFAYDAWNRLVSVKANNGATTVASYKYDALGRRYAEIVASSSTYVYFSPDWRALEERSGADTANNLSVQYVYGATGQAILRDGYNLTVIIPSSRRFLEQDANGSTVALATENQVLERYAYDAYGATAFLDANAAPIAATAQASRMLFQGGRQEAATGLDLFRQRDLDPTSGTWMERDPIGFAGGDANLYRFVGSNPINFIDPSGLELTVLPQTPAERKIANYRIREYDNYVNKVESKRKELEGIFKDMIFAGDYLYDKHNGNVPARKNRYGATNTFPNRMWPEYRKSIKYALDNYASQKNAYWPTSGTSFNVNFIFPGSPAKINEDEFFGIPQMATATTIHEPQHDWARFGPTYIHSRFKPLFPLEEASPHAHEEFVTYLEGMYGPNSESYWKYLVDRNKQN